MDRLRYPAVKQRQRGMWRIAIYLLFAGLSP
jgi:hypothetical protein